MSYPIHVEGLVKRYGGTVALDGVDLRVPAGSVAGVLGSAGSGKTTLIRVLSGLTGPDAGRVAVRRAGVLLLDEPTAGLGPHDRDRRWDQIRRTAGDGTAVLLTTRLPEEAGQLADRMIALDRGRVVASGRAGELRRRTGGRILQVRATVAADGAAVAAILHEMTGTVPARDDRTGLLSVPAGDPMLMSALVRRLDAADIPVDELGLRLPSLDEVLRSLR
ncbi:hypothetical protein Q0Z83_066320 [Actinoplanes sichuanensis]|uniref:ATP-binding cassette domain-containing protein n=1 Tax=Actinoplanes sichuanensis TaxID=512349 RepID=A0ABW4AN00_9ACTN|nr:ATP-binding cassette domain-containing protein [Actinoplanes sichuanensis]BEL08441.1 hypothetical protein Q0Z83_066320 [Actinoplanes sichuanensis]